MISLDSIITNNLQMLKEQEAELLKSLNFIQKAKALFESGGIGTGGGKRRFRKPKVTVNAAAKKKRGPKARVKAKKSDRKKVKGEKPGYMNTIFSILKEKKQPISSGELIETMFKGQTRDKDMTHYRTLVYPTLTKAYKSKVLNLKKGLIHLGKGAVNNTSSEKTKSDSK